MKFYNYRMGRCGNAIFRYFASVLLRIFYDSELTYDESEATCHLNDDTFKFWMNNTLNSKIVQFDSTQTYGLHGYFQHDEIYIKFKQNIKFWIETHPDELLYTDGNNDKLNYFNYPEVAYKAIDLLPKNIDKKYDIVIHLRLEDFINNNDVIHPQSVINVLERINQKSYCFVVNKPKLDIEHKYIKFLKKYGIDNDCEIIIESNDVITDYQIMLQSKILVCSYSTLSWCAALLSESVHTVYFLNIQNRESHCTFKKPIENTLYYDYTKCGQKELEEFFNKN